MKNLGIVLLLSLLSSVAAAHPLMDKFDLNSDGLVTNQELKEAGCSARDSKFKAADKNGDGKIDLEEYVQHFKVCNLNIPTLYYTNQISDLKLNLKKKLNHCHLIKFVYPFFYFFYNLVSYFIYF